MPLHPASVRRHFEMLRSLSGQYCWMCIATLIKDINGLLHAVAWRLFSLMKSFYTWLAIHSMLQFFQQPPSTPNPLPQLKILTVIAAVNTFPSKSRLWKTWTTINKKLKKCENFKLFVYWGERLIVAVLLLYAQYEIVFYFILLIEGQACWGLCLS